MKKTTESLEGNGKEREHMPKGKPITDEDVALMLQLRERGKTNKDLASIFGLSEDGIKNRIGSDKPKANTDGIDLSNIEKKLDEMPDRVVRRISEILDFAPNMGEHLMSLESIGYRSKDKKVYEKRDGNQIKQFQFHSKDQITYKIKDQNGTEVDRYYFNAETLEAVFGAIFDRGWNYFKK